jgi:hypothetical protein
MKKELASVAGGALKLTEEAGVLALELDASLQAGGGDAAGILSAEGKGSIKLNAEQAAHLGEKLLNAKLAEISPALAAGAAVVEGVVEQAAKALE